MLKGEVNERLPAVTNGLVAHFPFDESTRPMEHFRNELTSKRMTDTEDWYIPVDAPVFTGEGVYINGNSTCYLRSQSGSPINKLSGQNHLEVEIDIKPESYGNYAIVSQYSGYSHASRRTFTIRLNSNKKISVLVGTWAKQPMEDNGASEPSPTGWELGVESNSEVPLGKWSTVRLSYDRRALRVYINDQLEGEVPALAPVEINGTMYDMTCLTDRASSLNGVIFVGADGAYTTNATQVTNAPNDPAARVPGWTGYNNFKGYIRDLRISKMTPPLLEQNLTTSPDGVSVESATTNIWTGNFGLYNNFGVPASITQLDETYMGQPVYRVKMVVNSNLSDFQGSLYSHGVYGGNQVWKQDTKYVTSIYWRPVNKPDMEFGGVASNTGGWKAGTNIKTEDGWNRYYRWRDGVGIADKTDVVHHSFRCRSLKLNDTIYFDVTCPQTEQGVVRPTAYTPSSRGKGELHLNNLGGYKDYTVCGWFRQNRPFMTGGNYIESARNGATLISIHDTRNTGLMMYRYYESGANMVSAPYLNRTGTYLTGNVHQYYAVPEGEWVFFAARKIGTSFAFKLYHEGWKLEHLATVEAGARLDDIRFGDSTLLDATYKDLSVYNRKLTDAELDAMVKAKLSITDAGGLNDKVKESSFVSKEARHFPLRFNGEDSEGLVKPKTETAVLYTPEGAYLDKGIVNHASNPSSGTPITNGWDKNLHADALNVSGWGSGFNGGVGDPSIGHHAKWVNEGIDGGVCQKHMNLNSQFTYANGGSMKNRWMGIASATMGSGNSMGWNAGDTITISFLLKVDTPGKGVQVGIYHKSLASGGNTFAGSSKVHYLYEVGTWKRMSHSFVIDNDWDLVNTQNTIYVYGDKGEEGIGWVDDIQIEKNNYPSGFVETSSPYSRLTYPYADLFDPAGTGDFTISYWVKTQELGKYSITGTWPYFYFGISSSNAAIFSWMENSAVTGNVNTQRTIQSPGKVKLDTWTMLSCSVQMGGHIKIYMDGKLEASLTSSFSLTSSPSDYEVNGISPGNTSYPLNGVIRDLSVYRRALSDSEIATIYKNQMQATKDGLQIQGQVKEGRVF